MIARLSDNLVLGLGYGLSRLLDVAFKFANFVRQLVALNVILKAFKLLH